MLDYRDLYSKISICLLASLLLYACAGSGTVLYMNRGEADKKGVGKTHINVPKDSLDNSAQHSSGEEVKALEAVKIPHGYLCPILLEIMNDPMIAADGYSYEGEAIKRWLREPNMRGYMSPMTNRRLLHRTLIPNINLRHAIEEFKKNLPALQRQRMIEQDMKLALRIRETDIEELQDELLSKVKQRAINTGSIREGESEDNTARKHKNALREEKCSGAMDVAEDSSSKAGKNQLPQSPHYLKAKSVLQPFVEQEQKSGSPTSSLMAEMMLQLKRENLPEASILEVLAQFSKSERKAVRENAMRIFSELAKEKYSSGFYVTYERFSAHNSLSPLKESLLQLGKVAPESMINFLVPYFVNENKDVNELATGMFSIIARTTPHASIKPLLKASGGGKEAAMDGAVIALLELVKIAPQYAKEVFDAIECRLRSRVNYTSPRYQYYGYRNQIEGIIQPLLNNCKTNQPHLRLYATNTLMNRMCSISESTPWNFYNWEIAWKNICKKYVKQDVQHGDNKQQETLQSILSSWPYRHNLPHILVNLPVLSDAWACPAHRVEIKNAIHGSATSFYNFLTQLVWKDYAKKNDADLKHNDELSVYSLLERLALLGWEQEGMYIEHETVERLVGRDFKEIDDQNRIIKILQCCGFLQKQATNKWYFWQRGFQEYFMSNALAENFLSQEEKITRETVAFVSKYKYSLEFQRALPLVAGAMYKKAGISGVQQFFKILDTPEGTELIGLQHLLLQLFCLNECAAMGAALDRVEEAHRCSNQLHLWAQKSVDRLKRDPTDEDLHNTIVAALPRLTYLPKNDRLLQIYTGGCKSTSPTISPKLTNALTVLARASTKYVEPIAEMLLDTCGKKYPSLRGITIPSLPILAHIAPQYAKSSLKAVLDDRHNSHLPWYANMLHFLLLAYPTEENMAVLLEVSAERYESPTRNAHIGRAHDIQQALLMLSRDSSHIAEKVWEKTLKICRDKDQNVRALACSNLIMLVNYGAVKWTKEKLLMLFDIAEDVSDKVRLQSSSIDYEKLVWIIPDQKEAIFRPLITLCKDPNARVRSAAHYRLSQMASIMPEKCDFILQILSDALEDPDRYICSRIFPFLVAVAKKCPRHIEFVSKRILSTCKDNKAISNISLSALEGLMQLAPHNVDVVVKMLSSFVIATEIDEQQRRSIATNLNKIIRVFATQKICKIVKEALIPSRSDTVVKDLFVLTVLCVLAEYAPEYQKDILRVFFNSYKSSDPKVRGFIIRSMCQSKEIRKHREETLTLLLNGCEDLDASVRAGAFNSLGMFVRDSPTNAEVALKILLKGAKDIDKIVRSAAIKALTTLAYVAPLHEEVALKAAQEAIKSLKNSNPAAADHQSLHSEMWLRLDRIESFFRLVVDHHKDHPNYSVNLPLRRAECFFRLMLDDLEDCENVRNSRSRSLIKRWDTQYLINLWCRYASLRKELFPYLHTKLCIHPLTIKHDNQRNCVHLTLYRDAKEPTRWKMPEDSGIKEFEKVLK